jgi:transposase-like protein
MNGDTVVPARPSDRRSPACHCPRCVRPYLHRVGELGSRQLQCDSCGHSWQFEQGELRPLVSDAQSVSTSASR